MGEASLTAQWARCWDKGKLCGVQAGLVIQGQLPVGADLGKLRGEQEPSTRRGEGECARQRKLSEKSTDASESQIQLPVRSSAQGSYNCFVCY